MEEFEAGYVKRAVEDLHADFREFKQWDKEWKEKSTKDRDELRGLICGVIDDKTKNRHTWTTIVKGSKFLLAALCAIAMLKLGDANEFLKQLFKLLV